MIKVNLIPNDSYNKSDIVPNFIFNRLDLRDSVRDEYYSLSVSQRGKTKYVQFAIKENRAYVGVWLRDFSSHELRRIIRYIMKNFRDVSAVVMENVRHPVYGITNEVTKTNHFSLELTQDGVPKQLERSHKSIANYQRKYRRMTQFGKTAFEDYDVHKLKTADYKRFVEMKKTACDYKNDLEMSDFFAKREVTNVYSITIDGRFVSMIWTMEQCDNVYLENMVYDPLYAKYSPGSILYGHCLQQFAKKGKKCVYLAGDEPSFKYEYKRYYGSIEEKVYHIWAYRPTKYRIYSNLVRKIHSVKNIKRGGLT